MKDIASYFKISQSMVGRIVKEYQEDNERNNELIRQEELKRQQESTIKSTV